MHNCMRTILVVFCCVSGAWNVCSFHYHVSHSLRDKVMQTTDLSAVLLLQGFLDGPLRSLHVDFFDNPLRAIHQEKFVSHCLSFRPYWHPDLYPTALGRLFDPDILWWFDRLTSWKLRWSIRCSRDFEQKHPELFIPIEDRGLAVDCIFTVFNLHKLFCCCSTGWPYFVLSFKMPTLNVEQEIV